MGEATPRGALAGRVARARRVRVRREDGYEIDTESDRVILDLRVQYQEA